ncbi:hypothetical protein LTR08_008400 [Meristemomyces frigidus]|nr:hypothetical protein LTR08_008400 [Meristemomyces frigidus]
MRKVDSLLLESQRMNPVSLTSIHRRIVARNGIRLSTGHVIPHDTSIGFLHPFAPFSTPPPTLASFPAAQKQPPLTDFYPFRFSEQRDAPGEEGLHQFTQTGRENINFGHGPDACPGRWFASAELKAIMVELIMRYDFALGPNGEGETQSGSLLTSGAPLKRPQSIVMPGSLQYMPNPGAAVYFKDRKQGVGPRNLHQ